MHEHFEAMPASYLLNTPPDEIAAHISHVRRARAGHPVVRMRDDSTGRFTEITICALDDEKPGLLAKIAGVFAALDVDIHGAQVYTREADDRIAIDLIDADFDQRPLPELKRLQVQSELVKVLSGKLEVESLSKRFGKRSAEEVRIHGMRAISHASDQHTVIEIEAEDTPGLLHRVTRALSSLHWNVHSARVNTWGTRAIDAFYVTDEEGAKLDDDVAAELLARVLAKQDG